MTHPPPHPLSELEQSWLRWLLPAHSPACDALHARLATLALVSNGRWGDGDLLFAADDTLPDAEHAHAPVFAFGVIEFARQRVTLAVHEEDDGIIEVQITPRVAPNGETEIRRWALSHWTPGQRGPEHGGTVREIETGGGAFVLAICPSEQRLWLHERQRVYNRLLPATAVYNHLMQHKAIRNRDRVLAPKRLFSDHAEFSDIDLIHALRRYGERAGRFTIPDDVPQATERRFSLRRLFGGSSRHV